MTSAMILSLEFLANTVLKLLDWEIFSRRKHRFVILYLRYNSSKMICSNIYFDEWNNKYTLYIITNNFDVSLWKSFEFSSI